MNILEIAVDGFGVWNGLRLSELPGGVTVFYGPNEAGKTTLLQFVRTLLFGFSAERRERYLPPLRGGRAGGTLRIVATQGHYEIRRYDGGSDPVVGELRLAAQNGPLDGHHLLSTLLSGIDETVFNNVFAIGLREIQELGTLSDSGAGALLYRLTSGLDRVSLADVLRELSALRNRLLPADDRPSQIMQLLAERDRLIGEVEQLRKLWQQYAERSDQCDRIDVEVRQSETEQAELEKACRLVEIAVAVRTKWHERGDLQGQLESLGDLPPLPEGILEQFDGLKLRIARRTEQLGGWKRQRIELAQQIAALQVNELLWRQAPRIEALAEQQPWASSLETEADALRVERLQLEQQVADAQKQWGFKPESGDALPKVQVTGAMLKRLRPLARQFHAAHQNLRAAKKQNRTAGETVSSHEQEIRKALAGRPEKELAAALDKTGRQVTMLRRRVQLDERIEQMTRQRHELADQINLSLDRQLLPMHFLAALAALFAAGVVMILGASFLGSSILGPAGWIVAVLGLLATLAGVGVKLIYERSATNQLSSAQRQLTMVDAQFEQSKEEREKLDSQLPKGGGPLLTRLQAAEKDLAALEELLGPDGRRQAAQHEADRIGEQTQDARQEFAAARRRWQQGLSAAGLPNNVMPQHLKRLTAHYREFEELRQQLEHCRNDYQQRTKDLEGFQGRLARLLADVKMTPVSDRSADRVRQLQQELREQEGRVAKRELLRKQRADLGLQGKRELRALRVDRRGRLNLLRRAGVADEAGLRQLVAHNARRQRLLAEHGRLSHDIAVALGPQNTEQDLAQTFDKVPSRELEKHGQELAERRRTAHGRLQKLAEERGKLIQQLKSLAEDRRLAGKLLDLQVVEQQLQEAVDRWQTAAVTHRLLEAIRRTYEADHQPETLREASGYFEQLTGGHYVRVWTPLDDDVLRVDDNAGHTLPVEALSRGTREQLFLSLRLALVSAFGRRGANLPLVLDDVLVNFDVHRVEATARVLKQFAAHGFQVLLFTCHEHIAQIFHDQGLAIRELPSNTELGASSSRAIEIDAAPQPAEPLQVEFEAEPIEVEPAEVFVPKPQPEPIAELEIERYHSPAPPPMPRMAPPPPVVIEPPPPQAEPKAVHPMPPKPKRRRPPRVRRRRPEPFANAIWHEHVEEDLEADKPLGSGNGHGEVAWDDDEDSHEFDDAFARLENEPEDIEA